MNEKSDFKNFDYKKLVTQIRKSLAPYLTTRKVEKLETLQKEGEFCKQLYFIKKGSVKQYYVIEGKEFIQNLFFEGSVAALFNNFFDSNTCRIVFTGY